MNYKMNFIDIPTIYIVIPGTIKIAFKSTKLLGIFIHLKVHSF